MIVPLDSMQSFGADNVHKSHQMIAPNLEEQLPCNNLYGAVHDLCPYEKGNTHTFNELAWRTWLQKYLGVQ